MQASADLEFYCVAIEFFLIKLEIVPSTYPDFQLKRLLSQQNIPDGRGVSVHVFPAQRLFFHCMIIFWSFAAGKLNRKKHGGVS